MRDNDAYAWDGAVSATRGYVSNGRNQYAQAGINSLGHDPNGNLTFVHWPAPPAGQAQRPSDQYVYDVENRLVAANLPEQDGTGAWSAVWTGLRYDPLGRLYRVDRSGSVTVFVHSGSDLVAEYSWGGTLLRRHVHGLSAGDDPLVSFEGSGVDNAARRYLYADERGSVVLVTNGNGAALWTNSYDEYGIPGVSNAGRFQYTGQVWLEELGMYYYKARMYSPTLGRFLQPDPIGYGDGMNLYAYVRNDPVNGVDPTGMRWVPRDGVCSPGLNVIVACGMYEWNPHVDYEEFARRCGMHGMGSVCPPNPYTNPDIVPPWPLGPSTGPNNPGEPQSEQTCSTAAQVGAYASNANLVLEGSAALLGVGAIAASPTGVGGGVLGIGAAGAAAGAKLASVVSIGAYGYDYLTTGNSSSLVGAGAGVVSLISSGVATRVTGNIMRSGRMFGNLSAPQAARLSTAEAAYGSAAGMVENLLVDTGC